MGSKSGLTADRYCPGLRQRGGCRRGQGRIRPADGPRRHVAVAGQGAAVCRRCSLAVLQHGLAPGLSNPRKAGQQAQKRPGMAHIFVTYAAVLSKDLKNRVKSSKIELRFREIRPQSRSSRTAVQQALITRCAAKALSHSKTGAGPCGPAPFL